MYYLYHIPGKKIGVTRDLNNRVTVIQGYKPDEYEEFVKYRHNQVPMKKMGDAFDVANAVLFLASY